MNRKTAGLLHTNHACAVVCVMTHARLFFFDWRYIRHATRPAAAAAVSYRHLKKQNKTVISYFFTFIIIRKTKPGSAPDTCAREFRIRFKLLGDLQKLLLSYQVELIGLLSCKHLVNLEFRRRNTCETDTTLGH